MFAAAPACTQGAREVDGSKAPALPDLGREERQELIRIFMREESRERLVKGGRSTARHFIERLGGDAVDDIVQVVRWYAMVLSRARRSTRNAERSEVVVDWWARRRRAPERWLLCEA